MYRLCLFLLMVPFFVYAQPKGMEVIHGNGKISASNAQNTTIKASDGAVLRWQDFSIQKGEITSFKLPCTSSAVFNRVIGNLPSKMWGHLRSNGQVYLFNPAGIILGKDFRVSTNGFLAASFDVLEQDLIEGDTISLQQHQDALVVNYSEICNNGDVILLGPKVKNYGNITAQKGMVHLASGPQFLLKPKNTEKIFIAPSMSDADHPLENFGTLSAQKIIMQASSNPYALAINFQGDIEALPQEDAGGAVYLLADGGKIAVAGTIKATHKQQVGGTIHLLAQQIAVNDTTIIDASGSQGGGTVLVGGDFQGKNPLIPNSESIYFAPGATICADAIENGNGGKVILWAEKENYSEGHISARGGAHGGDGGLIEISSKGFLHAPSIVDLKALQGKVGELLYDPCNIRIKVVPDDPPFSNPYPALPFSGTANLSWDALSTNLASANVTLRTAGGSGGDGDITFDERDISWNAPHTLTLQADRDIKVYALISSVDATDHVAIDFVAGRDIIIGNGEQTRSHSIISVGGDQNYTAGRDVIVTGSTTTGAASRMASLTTNSGAINIAAHNLTLQGGTGTAGESAYAAIQALSIGAPDMIISLSEDLSLTSGSGDNAYTQIFSQGNISISGVQNVTLTGSSTSGGSSYSAIDSQLGEVSLQMTDDLSILPEYHNAYIRASAGDVSITNAKNVIVTGSSVANTTAQIQADNDIILTNIGSLYVTGGSGYARINAGNDITTTLSGSMLITAGLQEAYINAGAGSVDINAFQDVLLTSSTTAPAYITGAGNIGIEAGTIDIEGQVGQIAYIQNTSTHNVNLTAEGDFLLGGYALVSSADGTINIIAGQDVQLNNHSTIQSTANGDITVVVDNRYPAYPQIGHGRFVLGDSSQVLTDGDLRIFTSVRDFNSINNTINGVVFSPGEKFVDSDQERWEVYYPDSFFGGPGFTLFYKQFVPAHHSEYFTAIATSELFYRLDNMQKDFLFVDFYQKLVKRYRDFFIDYDKKTYGGMSEYNCPLNEQIKTIFH